MSQVQQIKDAVSIVEVIGERVQLNLAGAHYRGLCPFHGEKSPSFFVNDQLGFYKCFGCGEGGDVFTFLERYEGMTFREALEEMAKRTGIKLEERPNFKKEDDERDLILGILDEAADYFQAILKHQVAGVKGRAYLDDRQVTAENRRLFRLGYVTMSWDGLWRYLTVNKKRRPADILKTGLIIRSQNGKYFDRFRGRLMFPLKNHRGQIVGFSGRLVEGDSDKEAKYINTPETSVYHKSQLFYGLSENLAAIKEEKAVLVVEGEFDMISSVQAHVKNVVAIKGSALTDEHAKLIRRFVQKIYLALDADAAGVKATARACKALAQYDIPLRVIVVPEGKDPDELARTKPALWRETTRHSVSVYDYFISALKPKFDLLTIEGKTAYVTELAPLLGSIENAVEFDHYVGKLAGTLGVKQTSLEADIKRVNQKETLKVRGEKEEPTAVAKKPKNKRDDQLIKKENYLWFLFLNQSEAEKQNRLKDQMMEMSERWQQGELRTLSKRLADFKPRFELAKFNHFLPEDLQQLLSELYLGSRVYSDGQTLEVAGMDWEQEWQRTWADLEQDSLKGQLQKLQTELELLESKNELTSEDEKKQEDLLRQIVQLQQKMKF